MKKKYILLLLIFTLSIQLNAQWKRIESIPAPYNNSYYLDVYFLETNPQFGWACGRDGVTARTTDFGETWNITVIPFAYQLESIHFVNASVGYTSGLVNSTTSRGGVFKSTDGGRTWKNVSPIGNIDVWGTFFMDENNGLVIGGGCDGKQQFYKTTNGGKTWTYFTQNLPESGLSDLIMDKLTGTGYAVSSGWIWISTNFGSTWETFSRSGYSDWQEEISLSGNTFLVPYSEGCTGGGPGGGARISTDFGKTWVQSQFGKSMFGTYLKTPSEGWVVGWERSAYYTTNAGKTWANMNCGIPNGYDLDDIWFINDTLGFVVGQGIYKFVGMDTAKLEIAVSQSIPICSGDTVVLYIKKTYDNYKWSTGATSPSIKVTESGTYFVFASHNECDSATSIPINIEFLPRTPIKIDVTKIDSLCQGDTVVAIASGDFISTEWSVGSAKDTLIITESGKYYATGTDKNGCKTIDSIDIFFAPNPIAEIGVNGKTNFCISDSVILYSKYDYPQYEWFDSGNKSISTNKNISIFNSGTYRLFVKNEYGCETISDSIDVVVRLDTNKFQINYSVSNEFFVDSVRFPFTKCRKLQIKNIGWTTQIIENALLFNNTAFSIPQSQLPIVIPPQSTIELEICYSPTKIGIQHDTLYLDDLCSPHIVMLSAEGVPNNYNSDSKCEVPLTFETIDIIDASDFLVGNSFPNPAGIFVNIPMIKTSQKLINNVDIINNINISVIDFLGNEVTIPSEMIKINNLDNSNQSILNIDISQIINGYYLLNFRLNNIHHEENIIIYR